MRLTTLAILALTAAAAACPAEIRDPDWGPLQYLLGEWVGEGSGEPGRGGGEFSFSADLQGRVLIRKSRAEYPATKERPAFVHDDLIIVYRQPPGERIQAIYFDNEGHVIRYTVQSSPEGGRIVFLSGAEPGAPQYRFTYTRVNDRQLTLKFEIAPPGKPGQFATYLEGGARRK